MSDKKTPCSLHDLNPRWVGAGGEGITDRNGKPVEERSGVMVSFDCPCGCDSRCMVALANPRDGKPALPGYAEAWQRTGASFDCLTLHPSIQRRKWGAEGCTWHGWVELGQVRDA